MPSLEENLHASASDLGALFEETHGEKGADTLVVTLGYLTAMRLVPTPASCEAWMGRIFDGTASSWRSIDQRRALKLLVKASRACVPDPDSERFRFVHPARFSAPLWSAGFIGAVADVGLIQEAANDRCVQLPIRALSALAGQLPDDLHANLVENWNHHSHGNDCAFRRIPDLGSPSKTFEVALDIWAGALPHIVSLCRKHWHGERLRIAASARAMTN